MRPYINTGGVVYTNTYSIFTTNKLPETLNCKELVLKKDKLKGSIIEETDFLYIKSKWLNL
jgi:hypothetical protein